MRVVLDANVLISAVISPQGAPARLLDLWKTGSYELVISIPILDELQRVVHYPKIKEKYNLPKEFVQQFLRMLQTEAIAVEPSMKISTIKDDDTDNRYLECAVVSEASYIISGDRHLLELKEYRGIMILPAAVFLALLESGSLK